MKKPTNQLIKKNVKVFNDLTLVYQIMFFFFILNQFLKYHSILHTILIDGTTLCRDKVFSELTKLYPTHACREHGYVWPLLVQNCGYRYVCYVAKEISRVFHKQRLDFTLLGGNAVCSWQVKSI